MTRDLSLAQLIAFILQHLFHMWSTWLSTPQLSAETTAANVSLAINASKCLHFSSVN